ncbi:MAG: ATP-dependent RNA helicase HrpA [Deltaproteobacteria bacterium]|jgi:ATP-dependent helicase HrpA|nr:ATP-dependent RNA helicase HrpA [Deltaproteobacteria bacterium]
MTKTSPINYPEALPISSHRGEIIEAIHNYNVVIISGDTGSGKTTQLPKMCLEAGRGSKKMIGCTQPRRIAAITVAARVAEELGEKSAALVGHKIRFQDRTTGDTRIKFMTDGILLAETRSDHRLRAYDTLIIDEAHERSLNIDFLLGYTKQLLSRRKDLKVIITSATIDTQKFSSHFNDAPIIEVSGRTYPVEVRYHPLEEKQAEEGSNSYIDLAVKEIHSLCRKRKNGDILVFMPTERDISETVEILKQEFDPQIARKKKISQKTPVRILPLFGRLRPADQQRVFRNFRDRKIIVATNIAETSITVPGIRYVIDTGLARISTYNIRARTTSLPVNAVSRASCDQRKGRCGRVGPGICIRLYSQDDYLNRPEFTLPEIKRSNLAEVILRMIDLKLGDPATFPFIDPPAARAIRDGYELLHELGAIDPTGKELRLSATGRIMAKLPLDPRISRMIIEAGVHNCLREIIIIASALAIQDPRIRPAEAEAEADRAHAGFKVHPSDFLAFLKMWEEFNTMAFKGREKNKKKSRSQMRRLCRNSFLSYQRLREWQDIHEQISLILKKEKGFILNRQPASYTDIHYAILSGFLRNIGYRKTKNIYHGAQGKELMTFPGSVLFNKGGQWIMAADLVETTRLYARVAANIKVEWLEPLAGPLCRSSYSNPRWEKKTGRVIANEKVTLFGLVVVASRKVNFAKVSKAAQAEARDIFIHSALIQGELAGRYGFLENNKKLVARFENIEDRLRQRNILADDYVLYKFYDTRLDASVFDRASLNRFLKKQGDDEFLFMSEEDVLLESHESGKLSDFPKQITLGDNFSLKLSYSFDPGGETDGISVLLPVDLLEHISPEPFEWLVPGLLPEKVLFLLKGLPKNIRKKLIPIQQTADQITRDLTIYEGSLFNKLETLILKKHRVKISRKQWPATELPQHLRIRYLLQDSSGKTLIATRVFSDLKVDKGIERTSDTLDRLRKKWERKNLTTRDFDDLPEKIPLQSSKNKLLGFAYPGLHRDNKGNISIRLYTDPEKRRQMNRDGLLGLYSKQFPKQFKPLKKECNLPASQWALYEELGSRQQLNEDLYQFVLDRIFKTKENPHPSKKTFYSLVESMKKEGLLNLAGQLTGLVVALLKARREVIDQMSRLQSMSRTKSKTDFAAGMFREELNEIVPADFLQQFDTEHVTAAIRYCKALQVRMERAYASPEKDLTKQAQVEPFSIRLKELKPKTPSPECSKLLQEYRDMLAEFKISIFAQEMKTRIPVSAKRLEKKWQEISNCC